MPRKLKVYQTSLGFFDLAIAAPSMKAALEAWGAGSNLFHQGVAKESDDRKVIDAAMEKPGTILQRPVGSDGPFREHADLPTARHLMRLPAKADHRASEPNPRRPERSMKRRSVAPLKPSRKSRSAVKGSGRRKKQPRPRRKSDARLQWKTPGRR